MVSHLFLAVKNDSCVYFQFDTLTKQKVHLMLLQYELISGYLLSKICIFLFPVRKEKKVVDWSPNCSLHASNNFLGHKTSHFFLSLYFSFHRKSCPVVGLKSHRDRLNESMAKSIMTLFLPLLLHAQSDAKSQFSMGFRFSPHSDGNEIGEGKVGPIKWSSEQRLSWKISSLKCTFVSECMFNL